MSGRSPAAIGIDSTPLTRWEIARVTAEDPAGTAAAEWLPATVPGTVAAALRDASQWSLDDAPRRFDGEQWWYRTRFSVPPAAAGERIQLVFDGLATLAQVWLNGAPLLHSSNMFLAHRCDVGALLRADNELCIRFSPLDAFLAPRRRRPRWRTPMVEHPQLRWVRTTLLGRTPGWSPPAAAVGPWRPVSLQRCRDVEWTETRVEAWLDGDTGRLSVGGSSISLGGSVRSAWLWVERGGGRIETALAVTRGGADAQPGGPARTEIAGELEIPNVARWWPHTHGEPALYRAGLRLSLEDAQGAVIEREVPLRTVGFRRVELDRDHGRFAFRINGREIFCRGASWTPPDVVSLQATPETLRAALARVRQAGMNMLRVAGPMVYETDAFHDLCDELGILVWQDFMFANMDYPVDDADFAAGVEAEVRQQLQRLQGRPSLALLCGNSEGAQQAAMSGGARETWAPAFFETQLAAWARQGCPRVPYCPSSTHGGAFPFQANVGVTSYYGVGAYLRPLEDARRAELQFASECLAFANVPEDETLTRMAAGTALRCHQPRWKERVPRDLGAGWDFDDVRDHYLRTVFGVDPLALRYGDHGRYLDLSRVVTGEVMAATAAEWRRGRSTCAGFLVWFLQDLWPGAGWGVIDSAGLPKAPYYYLRRVLQPLALFATDEGTNGLMLHLANDASAIRVRLELQPYRHSQPVGRPWARDLALAAASTVDLSAIDLYEGFSDVSYAYRFGPPPYDLVHLRLLAGDGSTAAESFYFPQGLPREVGADVGLQATPRLRPDGRVEVCVQARQFAQSVRLDVPGFDADDQYFHLAPNIPRRILLRPRAGAAATPEGTVHALNAAASARLSAP